MTQTRELLHVIVATRPRAFAVLATSTALLATGLAVAPSASAGPPGHWTRLTSATRIHTDSRASLVRLGSKLEVVWSQGDTATKSSIRVRAVSLAGKVESTTHTVVSGWSSIINDPAAIVEKGHLLVAFGGNRTQNASDSHNGAMSYATSATGASWALGPGALTHTGAAAADYGTAAVDDAGTPYVAVATPSVSYVTLHRGIDASFPAAAPDDKTASSGGDVEKANLARDPKTGEIWASWYDVIAAHGGIWYQKVYPTKGPLRRAPGSGANGGGLVPAQAVAMTSRTGGGVYLAYALGYPTTTKIRVLKAGTSSFHDVSSYGAQKVALTAGVGGRIWLAWYDPSTTSVRAVRSNKTVSRFGGSVAAVGPTAKAGYGLDQISINGSKGPLDVVVTADVPNTGYQSLYHTQLYAPLSVKLSRSSVKSSTGGTFTVTVTEAGSPVPGARVAFGGVTRHTHANGKATFTISRHATKGKKTVTVSLTYYVTKKVTIRVT